MDSPRAHRRARAARGRNCESSRAVERLGLATAEPCGCGRRASSPAAAAPATGSASPRFLAKGLRPPTRGVRGLKLPEHKIKSQPATGREPRPAVPCPRVSDPPPNERGYL
jgi:hypothetical protein